MASVLCNCRSIPSPLSSVFNKNHIISNPDFLQTSLRKTHKTTLLASSTSSSTNDDHSPEIPIELRYPAFPTVADVNQICHVLPHRFPFLLVDRVIEYTPGQSAVGIKNVTMSQIFFSGHFPGRPVMPGVLIVEALAQLGCMVALQPEVGGSRDNLALTSINNVRFRKQVVPGDTLVMRATLVKYQKRFKMVKMEGKAYVGRDVVCEGEFMAAL